jgi:hypothetical protein
MGRVAIHGVMQGFDRPLAARDRAESAIQLGKILDFDHDMIFAETTRTETELPPRDAVARDSSVVFQRP